MHFQLKSKYKPRCWTSVKMRLRTGKSKSAIAGWIDYKVAVTFLSLGVYEYPHTLQVLFSKSSSNNSSVNEQSIHVVDNLLERLNVPVVRIESFWTVVPSSESGFWPGALRQRKSDQVVPQSLLDEIERGQFLKHFVWYQMFYSLVIDPVFSLTPFEGLGLMSFCELWTTGLLTQCSHLAVLIPNRAVTSAGMLLLLWFTMDCISPCGECPVSGGGGAYSDICPE